MKRLLIIGMALLCMLVCSQETATASKMDMMWDQQVVLNPTNTYDPFDQWIVDAIFTDLCVQYPAYTIPILNQMYSEGRLTIKEVNKDEFYHCYIGGDFFCVILEN